MDIKQLLEKMEEFAGEKVGQKPGEQWPGTDKGTPGKKLVGDSIIKDLSKGLTPKTREQELSEEFQAFLEAEFQDTVDKRPARKSDRHARGHEPLPRYKTVKTDESMSDKDIELQDYRSMSHKEFQNAYKMTKTEWINKNKSLVIKNPDIKKGLGLDEAGSPAQQAAIAIAMKKAGKKPKNEQEELNQPRRPEVIDDLPKTPQDSNKGTVVKDYNRLPKDPNAPQKYPTVTDEGVAYKTANPHPASKDPIVAKVLKQMRPGLTGLDMNNEAFLYFAYEIGKMRAREMWVDYGPAIKYFYQSGIGVNEDANTDNKLAKLLTRFVNQHEGTDRAVALDAIEYIKKMGHIEQFATSLDYFGVDLDEGWESGPEEYEEPYDDADDAYDRQRQEKIDTEAEKEWAKLPKVSTYQCIGRGANMEPNQKFGPEFDTLEKALEYRAEIMKDPKTPHPEHIGINTLTRVVDKEQTNEAVEGGGGVKDINDYIRKRDDIYKQLADPKQKDNYPWFKQALFDLMRTARQKGIKIEESRAHKQLEKWFKDRELAQKFASGELKVPTPQERNVKIEKPKKQIKEFGADRPTDSMVPGQNQQNNIIPSATDPKTQQQAQKITQATNALKAASGTSAPGPNIIKALNTAMQGKSIGGTDAKTLEPMMDVIGQAAQDPKVAQQFKSLAQSAKQSQQQQKTT